MLQSMGFQRVRHDLVTEQQQDTSTREGRGNPLQYSCLENPMDRGAWWHRVGHDWSDLAAAADLNIRCTPFFPGPFVPVY